MKTIIKSSALVFALALLSTGVFAANTAKTDTTTTNEVSAKITYSEDVAGVDVSIDNAAIGESTLFIYDSEGTLLLTDKFTNEEASVKRSYLLTEVAEGNFVIKVITNEIAVAPKDILLSTDSSKQ